MNSAENYLGIRMNKSLSSIDSMDSIFRKYIVNKCKKPLVDNISYYIKTTEFNKFKSHIGKGGLWDKFENPENPEKTEKTEKTEKNEKNPNEGINDWTNYREYIKSLFNLNDNGKSEKIGKYNNIHIAHYIKQSGLEPQIIPPESKVSDSSDSSDSLDSDSDEKPDKPECTIDDKTHDIKFTFKELPKQSVPIVNVIFCIDKKITIKPYEKEIVFKNWIHEKKKITIEYENKNGIKSEAFFKIIKENEKDKCKRVPFTKEIQKQALARTGNKCSKTGIPFDGTYFTPEFDHKDNMACNGSLENCNPLCVHIHNMKTLKNPMYDRLDDPKELLSFKMNLIKILLSSITTIDDKRIVKRDLKKLSDDY